MAYGFNHFDVINPWNHRLHGMLLITDSGHLHVSNSSELIFVIVFYEMQIHDVVVNQIRGKHTEWIALLTFNYESGLTVST